MFTNSFSFKKVVLILIIIGLSAQLFALPEKNFTLSKTATLDYQAMFDGNQIKCWLSNMGDVVNYHVSGKAGLFWPKDGNATAIFQAGPRFVGKVNGELRTAAVEYTSEFTPGKVTYNPQPGAQTQGVPDDPNKSEYRVYKINRHDSSDPASPAYNPDFATWPAGDGAPAHDGEYFTDLNQNGQWDTGEPFEDFNLNNMYDAPDGLLVTGQDPPEFLGDQQLWYVMNDFASAQHTVLFNTQPLGLEIQVTQYGFDNPQLENVMFVRWLVINKSGLPITEAHFGFWTDFDIGKATDDLAGCDTTLDLSYGYNGNPIDDQYGKFPPAVGFALLQGPIVPAAGAKAFTHNGYLDNYRNLPMTANVVGSCGQWNCDPENALELFNLLRGLQLNGAPVIDEEGIPTRYTFPGDPITGCGWIASDTLRAGDFRFIQGSGSFDLPTWSDLNGDSQPQVAEPGVQEIVGAIIIASGGNNLQAIANLRAGAQIARAFHRYGGQRPGLTITSPAGGEKISAPVNITWSNDTSKPLVEVLVPQYSNDGKTWFSIDTLTTNTGVYTWHLNNYSGAPVLYLRLCGFAADPNFPVNQPVDNGIIRLINCNFSAPVGPLIIDNPSIDDPPYLGSLQQSYAYILNISGDYPLKWTIIDPEQQPLSVSLELKNRYEDWHTVALNLPTEGTWIFPSTKYPNSTATYLRLKVSDGTNQVVKELPNQLVIYNQRLRYLSCSHVAGRANFPQINIGVVDFDEMNGHHYRLTFKNDNGMQFSIFDQNLQTYVLKDLPILTADEEAPLFDGLAVAIEDYPTIKYISEMSGWIAGNCNWTYSFTSQQSRVYPSEYEIRFTTNGSQDINGKQAPFEVWNTTENRQPKFLLGTASSTKYSIGIYELFAGTEQIVWAVNLNAPPQNPIAPQVGDIIHFFVAIPLSEDDIYEFTNEYVQITETKPLPQTFQLLPVYPNPFNPQTTIRYQLPQSALVTIQVYNLTGQLVKTLLQASKPAGDQTLTWDAGNLPSGIYFIRLQAGNLYRVQKCVLLK